MIPENIKNNTTIWIAGIIALIAMCCILAFLAMFVLTLFYGGAESEVARVLLTAQD